MAKVLNFEQFRLNEKKWSADVETKWTPAEGTFTKSAEHIAKYLKKESDSLKQAQSRLSLYRNRAGKNLSAAEKDKLELASKKLHALYKGKD